jgi:hypothetical protein
MDFLIMLGRIRQHNPNRRHLGGRREGLIVIDSLLLFLSARNDSEATFNDCAINIRVGVLLENFSERDNRGASRW